MQHFLILVISEHHGGMCPNETQPNFNRLYCYGLKVPSVEGRTTESWEFCGSVGWNLHFPDKEPENQKIIN